MDSGYASTRIPITTSKAWLFTTRTVVVSGGPSQIPFRLRRTEWEADPTVGDNGGMAEAKRTVIRTSPMAHFVTGFLALGMLSFVLALPILAPLLLIPIGLSYAIARYRTAVNTESAQIRTLTSTKTVPWSQIEGLTFDKHAWAQAKLTDGSTIRFPGVTFSTLPILSAASNGRVPNPYEGVRRD
ncbi:low molecular weight protein antigen 6 [Mycobacteroides abscessus subsp. abscessus]|nr:low molecular weight protein antigen 6 [Mycobacteroides abscessus]SHR30821.1 low molecular weight protein antigen 6 [Mycobacteroides abscessus subsp. abscessus]CPZ85923.1 low molecular weight protein antigen 6 [Mycobacteroides abscessus]SHT64741.1 low molecular weight protein antigen 6 [Mycobacteroides abscessus subsp. abscessus]SHU32992.1 low molecular weight protein antigen 6 [Mycobacteroides abscessus subsp. abscessus]